MSSEERRAKPLPRAASDALIADESAGHERLLELMRRLREPEHGCPWDIEQDFSTIAPYTIEEAFEVAEEIRRGDMEGLCGELGDLLFQVVYHAQMAEEAGAFGWDDVVRAITEKMLRRHPHVFANAPREGFGPGSWERQKAAERANDGANSALDGVALALPALTRAEKLQNRAARTGFDWPDISGVLDKIREESEELAQARESGDQAHIQEEYGDLLFVFANLGRHLGVDPEEALRAANAKFTRRFQGVEAALADMGKTPQQSDLKEMDELWNAVKSRENLSE